MIDFRECSYDLDLDLTEHKFIPKINMKQYDSQSRYIKVKLYNKGYEFDITDKDLSFRVIFRKPDNTVVFNDCTVVDNGDDKYVLIPVTSNTLAVEGLIASELVIMQGTEIFSTKFFYINCLPSLHADKGQVESSDEYKGLLEGLVKAEELLKEFEQLDSIVVLHHVIDVNQNTDTLSFSNWAEYPNGNDVEVFLSGVKQIEGIDFTIDKDAKTITAIAPKTFLVDDQVLLCTSRRMIGTKQDIIVTANNVGLSPNIQGQNNVQDILNLLNQEVIDARTDKKGFVNRNLKERLDKIETAFEYTAHINAVYAGCDNTGINDIVPILKNLIKDNTCIYFPHGKYLIGSHLEINGINNIKLIADSDAEFIDKGMNLTLKDGTIAVTPIGIKFSNINNLTLDGINFFTNNTNEIGASNRLPDDQAILRNNVLCIENSYNVKLLNIKVNNFVGSAVENYQHYLNQFYINLSNIKNLEVSDFQANKDCGGGEIIIFNSCEDVKIDRMYHNQDTSGVIIWSLFKMINCKSVKADNLFVKSTSNSSLMDISGENIEISNVNADYPNGKVIDVTLEWYDRNVDTDRLILRNITTNGEIFSSALIGDFKTLKGVVIDNCKTTQNIERVRYFTNTKNLTEYTVRNTLIENIADFNTNFITVDDVKVENTCNVINCKFIKNRSIYNESLQIETLGEVNVKSCVFDFSASKGNVRFVDRLGLVNTTDNTKFGSIIIGDTTFIDCKIYITSKIEFNNCKFINCSVINESNTNKRTSQMVFNNCDFEYNTTEKLNDVFVLRGTGKRYVFNNCNFKGTIVKDNNYLFGDIDNTSTELVIMSCDFDVYLNATTPLNIVQANLSTLTTETKIINCNFSGKNKVVNFSYDANDVVVSGSIKFQVVGCSIQRIDAFGSNGTIPNGTFNTTRVRLGITGCCFTSNTIASIEALQGFNKLVLAGNVEL